MAPRHYFLTFQGAPNVGMEGEGIPELTWEGVGIGMDQTDQTLGNGTFTACMWM